MNAPAKGDLDVESVSGRGRPEEERTLDAMVTMAVFPSNKKIIEQEADRRGAGVSRIVVQAGFKYLEEQGQPLPAPTIYEWMVGAAQEMKSIGEGGISEEEVELTVVTLQDLRGVINKKAGEVSRRKAKREELQRKREQETREGRIPVRLREEQKEWLKERAEDAGVAYTPLLREAVLQSLEEKEDMATIEDRLGWWANQVKEIIQLMEDGRKADARRRIQKVGESVRKQALEKLS